MLGDVRQTKLILPTHCTEVDQIPVTTVCRTIFDLAGSLRPGRTERALDHSLAFGLAPIERFWDVFMDLARRGRSGTVVMRALLMARGPEYIAPESELEARLLQLLREHGLPVPHQQVDFGDERGWIGRVDFRIPRTTLIVETDGRRYHSALLDTQSDRLRDERLAAIGLTVLRLTWKDIVEQPADCAARIAAELLTQAA
jgi:very-short-patch-repair endonuclease